MLRIEVRNFFINYISVALDLSLKYYVIINLTPQEVITTNFVLLTYMTSIATVVLSCSFISSGGRVIYSVITGVVYILTFFTLNECMMGT